MEIFTDSTMHLVVPPAFPRGILPRLTRYGSPAAERFGLKAASEFVQPIAQADWKDFIVHCDAERIFPKYHRKESGLEQKPSQNGTNYCWSWSARAALENSRLLANQGEVRLAPISMGWLVNWRNQGNYMDVTVKGLRERGMASEEFCPSTYDYSGRSFKDGWEADAMKYRLEEVWDTNFESLSQYIGQILAILGTGTTCYGGWDRLGHAMDVDGMTWDETQYLGLIWDVFNSHGDGAIQMAGRSAVPDECYGFRFPQLPGA